MPQSPLMGSFFYSPGKVILQILPSGARLRLEPEPSNPYDPNAIKVMADGHEIPTELYSEASNLLAECGMTLDELLAPNADGTPFNWQLGHIARGIAAENRVPFGHPAELRFDGKGKPLVIWTDPDA